MPIRRLRLQAVAVATAQGRAVPECRQAIDKGDNVEVRVFLVEDLARMRGLMDDLFASLGGIRVVAVATTEAEARFWLDENHGEWDVAVLDLVLEQGGGMNIVRHCKAVPLAGKVVIELHG